MTVLSRLRTLEAGTATVARAEVRAKADMVTDRIMKMKVRIRGRPRAEVPKWHGTHGFRMSHSLIPTHTNVQNSIPSSYPRPRDLPCPVEAPRGDGLVCWLQGTLQVDAVQRPRAAPWRGDTQTGVKTGVKTGAQTADGDPLTPSRAHPGPHDASS